MLIGLRPSQVVRAAATDVGAAIPIDGPTTASTIVQVDVVGRPLALIQVPDLRFKAINVSDLIRAEKRLSLESGAVTKDGEGPGFDGDDHMQIVVSDLRGTDSGWQLLVKLDAFKLADTQTTIMPRSATFASSKITGDNVSEMTLANLNFVDHDTPVMVAPVGRGTGITTVSITAASVILPQINNALAGDYRAPLNWLLVSGPLP